MPIPGAASSPDLLTHTLIITTLIPGMVTDTTPGLTSASDPTDPGTMAGSVEDSAAGAERHSLAGMHILNFPITGKARRERHPHHHSSASRNSRLPSLFQRPSTRLP